MDYDFRRNTFDDTFQAEFSMGHEALGRWLSDEIETDHQAIDEVIEQIELRMAQGGEWQRQGKVFHLSLTSNEALIKANSLFDESEQEMPDHDLHLYAEESISLCGLDDLLNVLHAWQDFIRRYGR